MKGLRKINRWKWRLTDRCNYVISPIICGGIHFSHYYRDAASLHDFAGQCCERRFIKSSAASISPVLFRLSLQPAASVRRPLEKWFHSRSESRLSFASIAIDNCGCEFTSILRRKFVNSTNNGARYSYPAQYLSLLSEGFTFAYVDFFGLSLFDCDYMNYPFKNKSDINHLRLLLKGLIAKRMSICVANLSIQIYLTSISHQYWKKRDDEINSRIHYYLWVFLLARTRWSLINFAVLTLAHI